MLFHIALRSLCDGSQERLFLQEPIDPFEKTIKLDDTSPAFTRQYLDAFRSELPEREETALLQDRLDTGWLVWGKEMETSRLSAWDEMAWKIDESCRPGLDLIQSIMKQDGWWRTVSSLHYRLGYTWRLTIPARGPLGTRRHTQLSFREPHRLCPRDRAAVRDGCGQRCHSHRGCLSCRDGQKQGVRSTQDAGHVRVHLGVTERDGRAAWQGQEGILGLADAKIARIVWQYPT